jgi:hypothetical protein
MANPPAALAAGTDGLADFFTPAGLPETLPGAVAMGAALPVFPPGADGKAELRGAMVATCAPGNCAISRSPNDAAGAAVAVEPAETTAAGLSAVTGTVAINA